MSLDGKMLKQKQLSVHPGNHTCGNRSDAGQSQAAIFGTYNSSNHL